MKQCCDMLFNEMGERIVVVSLMKMVKM